LISDETGKNITYHDISVSDFKENLKEAGLPNEVVMMSTGVATTFVNGGLDFTHNDLSKLLGRKAAAIGDFLPEVI
jgi:hypothetical protein